MRQRRQTADLLSHYQNWGFRHFLLDSADLKGVILGQLINLQSCPFLLYFLLPAGNHRQGKKYQGTQIECRVGSHH